MRRFRKRKPKVVWLPMLGNKNIVSGAQSRDYVFGEVGRLTAPASGGVVYDAFAVTHDSSANDIGNAQTGGTLHDMVSGNEYRLRRIVGKCFVAQQGSEASSQGGLIYPLEVACGFIVSKQDEDGSPSTDFQYVNPLSQGSVEDPWIWQRRWILGVEERGAGWTTDDTSSPFSIYQIAYGYPQSNAGYGSVQDGPHIDQKTARVIGRQERLYCVFAARIYDSNNLEPVNAQDQTFEYNVSIRALASLRTNMGNRRNASR